MEIFIIIITSSFISALFCAGVVMYILSRNSADESVDVQDDAEDMQDTSHISDESLAKINDFQSRINVLKEELALKNPSKYSGTPAQELHPSVKNLPHDEVKTKYDLYDLEVAD